tara:strand:- start:545 stop:1066 length:522 start_codon:yes stop_codon:yes gene_type:complete
MFSLLASFLSSLSLVFNALTATKCEYSANPSEGRYIDINGKKTGVASWLKSKLKINSEASFQLFNDHVRVRSHSLIGDKLTLIPLRSVNSIAVLYGREKKISYLFVGILTIPFGIGVILVLSWLSSKTLLIITIIDNSGTERVFPYTLSDSLNIDRNDAEKMGALIYKLSTIS